MRLRDRVLLAGLVAVWPFGAAAQAPPLPVIGFLHAQSEGPSHLDVTKFREGLAQEGFVEGQSVAIEYKWGNNIPSSLPGLAADLVQHRVAVIVTAGGLVSGRAAKTATATIPIVFVTGLIRPRTASSPASIVRAATLPAS